MQYEHEMLELDDGEMGSTDWHIHHHLHSQHAQQHAHAGMHNINASSTATVPHHHNHLLNNSSHHTTESQLRASSPPSDQLERIGRWLSSIPRDDTIVLHQTPEYRDFLHAFERLGHAHRRIISMNRSSMSIDEEAALLYEHEQQQQHQQLKSGTSITSSSSHSATNLLHHQQLQQQYQQQQPLHQLDLGGVESHHSHPTQNLLPQQSNHNQQQLQQQSLHHSQHHSHPHHIPNNFLQQLTADDVILRIFEFLECKSLIRTSMTCSRFRQLAHQSATQRTYDVANARQLNSVMMLLRAKEQIDGVGNHSNVADRSHVRVPILLLHRRVIVTNAGDPEYNGVYYCTGCNGNGFVFSKPRDPPYRIQRSNVADGRRQLERSASSGLMRPHAMADFANVNPLMQAAMNAQAAVHAHAAPAARFESEVARPGKALRCILAKRFSNETILWYMSKEVEATETRGGVRAGEVTQCFSYWSKLMVIGDASPDVCRYPSQSSVMARHNEGWQTLLSGREARCPTIELLD